MRDSFLKDAFDHYGVKDYEVIEKGGVKIALLGVFGKDSLSCAPTCALEFKRSNRGGEGDCGSHKGKKKMWI